MCVRARAHNKARIGKHFFIWICIRLCMTKISYVESVRWKCLQLQLFVRPKKEKSRLLNNFRICHQRRSLLSVVSRDLICIPTTLLQETHTPKKMNMTPFSYTLLTAFVAVNIFVTTPKIPRCDKLREQLHQVRNSFISIRLKKKTERRKW